MITGMTMDTVTPNVNVTVIKFYRTNEEHGFLGNFWSKNPFFVESHYVQNSEALYQALKFNKTDPTLAVKILTTKKPGDAAKLGRDKSFPLRNDWDAVKQDAMRLTLMYKFEDEELMDRLLKTGNAVLIEDSPIDWYWGCGKDGQGENILGKLLMELRDWWAGKVLQAGVEGHSSTWLGFEWQQRGKELHKWFTGVDGRMFAPNFVTGEWAK